MAEIKTLLDNLQSQFGDKILKRFMHDDQLTIEIAKEHLKEVCLILRDDAAFHFEQLMDLAGIDYLAYGSDEWKKQAATLTGYSRGVSVPHPMPVELQPPARFAVAYQLLSIKNNQRLRLKVFIENEPPLIDSVIDIWESTNWYEREAFDLYGILFNGHPDLRRILTDYGFIGHPFRKDFPLIGDIELRYDATTQRCIYEPVSIRPRTLVPKVIREDHRYIIEKEEGIPHG